MLMKSAGNQIENPERSVVKRPYSHDLLISHPIFAESKAPKKKKNIANSTSGNNNRRGLWAFDLTDQKHKENACKT